MLKFIVRRALWTIPVVLLVVFMTFVMMRQIKGNPFQVTERAVPVSIQRNLDRKYHLNKPWYTQYLYYVKGVSSRNTSRCPSSWADWRCYGQWCSGSRSGSSRR